MSAIVAFMPAYQAPDWAVLFSLGLLMYYTIMQFRFRGRMRTDIYSVWNYNFARRLFISDNPDYSRFASMANLFFFLLAAFALFWLNHYFSWIQLPQLPLLAVALLLAVLLAVYLAKWMLYQLIGSITSYRKLVSEYVFNFYLVHRLLAFVLFPVVLSVPFLPASWRIYLFYILFALFAAFLLMLSMRLLGILLRHRLPLFFVLLFFIMTELFPLAIIYRLFINQLHTGEFNWPL